tara:strand:+ start:437 stop:631 length:195 start_codon:yes stop_codon:yes gene_type:complete
MNMNIAEQALKKIEIHEAECKLRYENIERRLGDGQARFKRLELMLWGVYPFILGTVFLAQIWES